MKLRILETHVRCETGRTLTLPRLATGRLQKPPERDRTSVNARAVRSRSSRLPSAA